MRILNLLLDQVWDKLPEHIYQEQVFIIERKDTNAQNAEMVDGDQEDLSERGEW